MTHDQAIWQIITAAAVILTYVAGHLSARRDRRVKQQETADKIQTVQETVNGTTHVLAGRVDQLTNALSSAGIAVPPPPDGTTAQETA